VTATGGAAGVTATGGAAGAAGNGGGAGKSGAAGTAGGSGAAGTAGGSGTAGASGTGGTSTAGTGGTSGGGAGGASGGGGKSGGGACDNVQPGLPMDVAHNKPSTASKEAQPASNANDGDTMTEWSSGDGSEAWWLVDLQKPYRLTSIQTQWEEGGVDYHYYIETSANGADFTKVIDQTTNTQGLGTFSDLFPSGTCARFVRVTMTDAGGFWAILREVQVNALTPQ
jgi:hypothetical protein